MIYTLHDIAVVLILFLRDFMEDVFHTGSNLKFPAVCEKGDLSKYYVVSAQNKGYC